MPALLLNGWSLRAQISQLHFSRKRACHSCQINFEVLSWLSCINKLHRKSDSLSYADALVWKQKEWKKGLWSQLRGILEQKPHLNDLSLSPLWSKKHRLPTASVWAALAEYLGRAAPSKTVSCEALALLFSLCRETLHTERRGSTAAPARGYLVLDSLSSSKVRETFSKHRCILLPKKRIDEE